MLNSVSALQVPLSLSFSTPVGGLVHNVLESDADIPAALRMNDNRSALPAGKLQLLNKQLVFLSELSLRLGTWHMTSAWGTKKDQRGEPKKLCISS